MSGFSHIPVLRDEAVRMLTPGDGKIYLDGTFGGGGYAGAILDSAECRLIAVDRDPAAVARGATWPCAILGVCRFVKAASAKFSTCSAPPGSKRWTARCSTSGVSSYQIDDPARGFSFRQDGPLDMQMGGAEITAATLVNTVSESELADILYQFGEEKASRRIAKAIVERRRLQKFATTADLAGVIRSVVRADKSGIDPATRSFQALRIAVNDELGDVAAGLAQAASLLVPGGRLVVVSFHSLEDRIVKRFFAQAAGRTPGASRGMTLPRCRKRRGRNSSC